MSIAGPTFPIAPSVAMALRAPSRLASIRHRRYSVEQYEALIVHGQLTENDRCELIRGVITDKMGIGDLHAACVNRLNWLFHQFVGRQFLVAIQNPIRLSDSEPEPDCVLVGFQDDFYGRSKPRAADVRLLVEVADSSLDLDRQVKLPLYAENGIPEYWIVNLIDDCIEVHRQPQGLEYAERRVVRRGESFAPLALPQMSLTAEMILGPADPARLPG